MEFSSLYSLIKKEDEAFKAVKTANNIAFVYLRQAEQAKTEEDKAYFTNLANGYFDEADKHNKELRKARESLFAYFDLLKLSLTE
jgi:hypothetical protein